MGSPRNPAYPSVEVPTTENGVRRLTHLAHRWRHSYLYSIPGQPRVQLFRNEQPHREADLMLVLHRPHIADMVSMLRYEILEGLVLPADIAVDPHTPCPQEVH